MDRQSTLRHTNIMAFKNSSSAQKNPALLWRQGCRKLEALVRGPAFLAALSFILLLTIPTAHATLLKGYLRTDEAVQSGATPGATVQQPLPGTSASAPGVTDQQALTDSQSQLAAPPKSAAGEQAEVSTNSFPPSFTGWWKCITVVTGSGLASVPVGQRVESEVRFAAQPDGRIMAEWEQPGWTQALQHITPMSENEAALERTNYFVDQGASGAWAARSHDHYVKVDGDRMVANSRVDQFMSGRFMGQYQTRSMLYRLDAPLAWQHARKSGFTAAD